MNEPSVFTKIIKGEIPSHKVYEDENSLAFLNIHPSVPGHVLVVPKKQVGRLEDMGSDDYTALMLAVQKVLMRVKTVLGVPFPCVKVEGFDITNHAHVHVVPCHNPEDFAKREATTEPDHEALAAMAQRLYFE
jgi:histidine triad (HIT) family protein